MGLDRNTRSVLAALYLISQGALMVGIQDTVWILFRRILDTCGSPGVHAIRQRV